MADLKISQLSSATALAGTEVVPVVQGGSTKKATIAQILAPAAGGGIDFSASSHTAGMTSELLNDYEEGTWTPTIRGSTTAGTYEIQTNGCTYTKIGRQVTLNVFIQLASSVTGGGAGDLQITGIPFAKAANSNPVAAVYLATGIFVGAAPTASWTSFAASSTIIFNQVASGGFGTNIPVSFASAGAYIAFTMTYFV